MKKTGMMWGLCITMGLSTASFAGAKDSSPVYVDPVNGVAIANMGAARNSPDTNMNLYCHTNSYDYGYCSATDASGTTVSCMTNNASMLAVIRSMSSDAAVLFYFDSTGTCTDIMVGTGSHHEPKAP
ncbi:hypothetical protein D7X96_16530 [Corallococcus interemptor]|uniref:Uncharacterized protein n=1 Tax=Corallococcus interemptor TaxID=2316720 RepID=A0A3A8QVJ2_9BACT|nr:hypothetical protein [Corallococcus interemptor]RKH68822.1 hypothetical protein D7X96_16530 [Corallococcus interemptor]